MNGVGSLQNYCRKYFGSFFSLRTFSKSLNAVGKEKIKLEKKKLMTYYEYGMPKTYKYGSRGI